MCMVPIDLLVERACPGGPAMSNHIAIIVEWDNARLSEVDRAREMLRRLASQTAEASARGLTDGRRKPALGTLPRR